jgi:hypothetical protein
MLVLDPEDPTSITVKIQKTSWVIF